MKLSVYSLKQILFEGEAKSVHCATEGGEITVLDRHAPLIATLKPCTLTIVDANNKNHYLPIDRGFLEVREANTAKILADET